MSPICPTKVFRGAHLVPEETARDVNFFTSHDHNLLAREDLLRNNGGQSTKEMPLAINDDGRRGESGHCRGLPADQSAVIKIPQ
jgi:hypothetical protein